MRSTCAHAGRDAAAARHESKCFYRTRCRDRENEHHVFKIVSIWNWASSSSLSQSYKIDGWSNNTMAKLPTINNLDRIWRFWTSKIIKMREKASQIYRLCPVSTHWSASSMSASSKMKSPRVYGPMVSHPRKTCSRWGSFISTESQKLWRIK